MKKKYEVRHIVTAVASIPVYKINGKTEAYKLAAKDGWGTVYRDENNALVCDEDNSASLYTKNGGYFGIFPYEEINVKEMPKQAACAAIITTDSCGVNFWAEDFNQIHIFVTYEESGLVDTFRVEYGEDAQPYGRKTLLGNSGTPTSPPANSFLAALPADLRAAMKSTTKYTDNTGGGSNTASYVTATTDYLFLLSEFEVFGSRSYANSAEQNYQLQYDYYKAGNSKIAYRHTDQSSAVWWWLRSPLYSSSNDFLVTNSNGSISNHNANNSGGLRPGFSV